MNEELVNVGQRIKELREKNKLSQAKLANLLGCSQSAIAKWEREKDCIPNKEHLNRLAKVLEVSIDYLLGINKGKPYEEALDLEITSEEFTWPRSLENRNGITLKIANDFLEPIAEAGDYAIFRKDIPKNGDVVIIRFPEEKNRAMVKMWRENKKYVMLTEINLEKIEEPYVFEIEEQKNFEYKTRDKKTFVVEGKLAFVKKNVNKFRSYLGIGYKY